MKTTEDKIKNLTIKLEELREQQRLEECERVKTKLIETGFSFEEQYVEITFHNNVDILFFAKIKNIDLRSSSLINVFYDWSVEVKHNSILIEKDYTKYYSIKEMEKHFELLSKDEFENKVNGILTKFKI
jgi:hypothetical protein